MLINYSNMILEFNMNSFEGQSPEVGEIKQPEEKWPSFDVKKELGCRVVITTPKSIWSVIKLGTEYKGRVIHRMSDEPDAPANYYEFTVEHDHNPYVYVANAKTGRIPHQAETGFLDTGRPDPKELKFQQVKLEFIPPGQQGYNEGDDWNRVLEEITTYTGTGSVEKDLLKPFIESGMGEFRQIMSTSLRAKRG